MSLDPSDSDQSPYITTPDAYLAEGELMIEPGTGNVDEQVTAFLIALMREALKGERKAGTEEQSLSSLSVRRVSDPGSGRVYGQAYLERKGSTVHYVRARLYDEQGKLSYTGMATSHILP